MIAKVTALFIAGLVTGALMGAACGDPEPSDTAGLQADTATATVTATTTAIATITASPRPAETEQPPVATPVPPTPQPTVAEEIIAIGPNQVARGGSRYEFNGIRFSVPVGFDVHVTVTLNDPGGTTLTVIYDPESESALKLRDGREIERVIGDERWRPAIEAIAASVEWIP